MAPFMDGIQLPQDCHYEEVVYFIKNVSRKIVL